jgi:hypothetical protein
VSSEIQPFIYVALAQEISNQTSVPFIIPSKFSFCAMRDNGDDAFGEPLSRLDRPVHVSTSLSPPPSSTLTLTSLSPSTIPLYSIVGSSSSSTTPLDLFIQSVHRALDSGLSKETLIANIHLISDECTTAIQPASSDDFFSQ